MALIARELSSVSLRIFWSGTKWQKCRCRDQSGLISLDWRSARQFFFFSFGSKLADPVSQSASNSARKHRHRRYSRLNELHSEIQTDNAAKRRKRFNVAKWHGASVHCRVDRARDARCEMRDARFECTHLSAIWVGACRICWAQRDSLFIPLEKVMDKSVGYLEPLDHLNCWSIFHTTFGAIIVSLNTRASQGRSHRLVSCGTPSSTDFTSRVDELTRFFRDLMRQIESSPRY